MEEYLKSFFELCEYPADAAASLLSDYGKIRDCAETRAVFDKYIGEYESADNGKIDFDKMLEEIRAAVKASNVHTYAAELLIYCCFTRHLRELYRASGISDDVWKETVLDLRYKLIECHTMHGIWGSFVAYWFDLFFCLRRFSLGRLQYEECSYFATDEPYTRFGLELIKDRSRAIQLHIPSSGRLTSESVTESLKKAYGFFTGTEYIQNGLLVCECSSWLLYPEMKKFMPEGSNVLKFQDCFEITKGWEDAGFHDCWRIFNRDWDGSAAALPRDTSMRKAYARWLDAGNSAGCGLGILLFDGEKIINR